MGPGLLFQLDPVNDPATARACYFCHAPLSRQSEISAPGTAPDGAGGYNETLKLSGVSCSACHVRGPGVSGPLRPRLKGLNKGLKSGHKTRKEGFFEKAEFCAACHQLKNGFRINGTLLVNTYSEWKESEFGRAGVVCQSCHMPGRRHLFRGIHDPEMTRSGVKIEYIAIKSEDKARGLGTARLVITNTATGHYFPTYATPLILVKGYLAGRDGSPLKGTAREDFIGRKLVLDLSGEFFDTRIAPQKSFVFEYPLTRNTRAESLVFEVTVYPDEFYNRFYQYYLTQEPVGKTKELIEQAHKESSTSGYELFRKEIPLKDLNF